MKITIRHQFSVPVEDGVPRAVEHLLLTSLSGPTQTIREWSIEAPGIETAARFIDAFGNRALLLSQARPLGEFTVSVTGSVETHDRNGVLGRVPGEPVVALYRRVTALTQPDPVLLGEFATAERHGSARIALFHAVMDRLGELYRFGGGEAPARSQVQDGQSQSQGAAPDDRQQADAAAFAHQFIGTLRALDLPARFVTGYLAAEDDRPAAFHAWAEAYDEGLGWIAFDAALGLCPTDRHVRVAAGLDAQSTLPIRIVPMLGEPRLLDISVEATAVAAQ